MVDYKYPLGLPRVDTVNPALGCRAISIGGVVIEAHIRHLVRGSDERDIYVRRLKTVEVRGRMDLVIDAIMGRG